MSRSNLNPTEIQPALRCWSPPESVLPRSYRASTRGSKSALLADEAGDCVHEVELGEDFALAVFHGDEHGRAFVAQQVGDALDRRVGGTSGSGAPITSRTISLRRSFPCSARFST